MKAPTTRPGGRWAMKQCGGLTEREIYRVYRVPRWMIQQKWPYGWRVPEGFDAWARALPAIRQAALPPPKPRRAPRQAHQESRKNKHLLLFFRYVTFPLSHPVSSSPTP